MKKQLALCLLVGLVGSAHADDAMMQNAGFMNGPKLYVGGSLGSSQQGDTCNDPFFEGECNNKDMAWKAFGGVRVNPMVGAELSYNQMGKTSMNGKTGSSPATMENTLTGTSVAGVGYVPVAPNIEAFGKAGAIFWQRETSATAGSKTEQSKDDGTSPLLGAGAQYQLNGNLHLRGEWEHMFNLNSDSDYETDADLYSIGLMYSTL
jgi:opacity protein-like surface antigen